MGQNPTKKPSVEGAKTHHDFSLSAINDAIGNIIGVILPRKSLRKTMGRI
jgi:hypothetical protein